MGKKIRYIRRYVKSRAVRLDRALSKAFLCSEAGAFRYLFGSFRVTLARYRSPHPYDGGWERGYRLLERFYDPNFMRHMQEEFECAINTEGAFFRPARAQRVFRTSGDEISRHLKRAEVSCPSLQGLVSNGLIESVGSYFGAKPELQGIFAWRNWHVPEVYQDRDMLSCWWHQDSTTANVVKVFVTLSDTELADGPLHFLPRAESREVFRENEIGRPNSPCPPGADLSKVQKLLGPAGTAVIVNTMHCLHKAGIPEKGRMRDIAEIRFKV